MLRHITAQMLQAANLLISEILFTVTLQTSEHKKGQIRHKPRLPPDYLYFEVFSGADRSTDSTDKCTGYKIGDRNGPEHGIE